MAKTVTVTAETQQDTLWTPERKLQFRIGLIRLWMQDCNEKSEEGRKVHQIFNTYLCSMQRQLIPSRPGKAEHREMQKAIESIHAILDILEEENLLDLHGWRFGEKVSNRAQGMYATMVAIRGELLQELTDFITN